MSSQPSLPDDPLVRRIAEEVERTRGAATFFDAENRVRWVSEEMRALLTEETGDPDAIGLGRHLVENYLDPAWSRLITVQSQLETMQRELPYIMWDTPGGKDAVKAIFVENLPKWLESGQLTVETAGDLLADVSELTIESFLDLLFDQMEPLEPPTVWTSHFDYVQGHLPPMRIHEINFRLRAEDGSYLGTVCLYTPAVPARVLTLVARGDEGMYSRMVRLVEPGRRRAAILFGDLESSGQLSRRLPSAAFFRLIRELTTAMDEAIAANGGIVGKHAGDGVTAFFLVEDLGSPSAAARAALGTAREIAHLAKRVAGELAADIGLLEEELCRINVGVHWGGRLYMGQLVTGGRLEVTALGDAVNECARIQESARNGAILASKDVIEHLADDDAAALALDPDSVLYTTVADLPEASEKAKRDAGGIPVTSLVER